MPSNHKLISVCFGLIFVIVLQKFANPEPVFRFLIPSFFIYCLGVTYYNYKSLLRAGRYDFWSLLRPLMLLFALFGLFLIFPTPGLRGLFLIGCVLAIIAFEIMLGKQAENLLLNQNLLIAFAAFMSLSGGSHYFPQYGPVFLALIFFSALLLARSFYEFIPQPDQIKNLSAIIIGLFTVQIFWLLSFLPFHFSVLGILLFNFFYFCLILNFYYIYHILNMKKLQFHLFLIAATSLLVLLATPWKIIS